MKILLMGDASNYHHCLAKGLAAAGHDVTVASHGSRWMQTGRDIDLYRHPGKLGGLWLWTRLNTSLARLLRGFDAVLLGGTYFIDQKPGRIEKMFDRLKRDNGSIYLTALGTDTAYVDYCMQTGSLLRYNEWREESGSTPYALIYPDRLAQWRGRTLRHLCNHIYSHADGIITALFEYHVAVEAAMPYANMTYAGIPIDTASVKFEPLVIDGPVKVLQGCHTGREVEKGAFRLRAVVNKLVAANYGCVDFSYVTNLPYDSFLKRLAETHIVIDQLYSFTPATTALLAMAMGKVVVSGGEQLYYDFIREDTLRPIVNPIPGRPDLLLDSLTRLINEPDTMARLGREGRRLVERHNDVNVVARRVLDFIS